MISVVVLSGGSTLRLLCRTLSHFCETLCVTGQEIHLPGEHPDILLVEAASPLDCKGDVIYILGARPPQPEWENFSPGPHAVAVIHSHNAEGLAFAARRHLKTLTCGLSSRDTLTLSSLTGESAGVCLQREIAAFGGKRIEPADIPVRLRGPLERFELLTLAAVLLLCGLGEYLEDPF
ncbi:MAG: hypothetical protein HFG26_06890 [Provencibacterium sp.]|jgi:hypothetical protein|nr:hypothetical protein [Provencibacterium sp.]